MPSFTLKTSSSYRLRSLKATLLILLSVASSLSFSKQLSFDFSSDHGRFLFGHEVNEFSQYTDINDSIKLTVTPKSTSTPHLQQCHNFEQPNNIYVHQSFSGLGVKYKPKHFWMPPFLDSGYLDTYSGYTDRLSFEFTSTITGESIPVTVKTIRFKRFEPLLFLDDAYIQDASTGEVVHVSKDNIDKDLFLELFPTSFMDEHTLGFWRFDTALETSNFVITPGKFDAFKVYSITIEVNDAEAPGPEITSTPLETAKEGDGYVYQVLTANNASDYLYTLTQAPTGMIIDGSTGAVSWTPSFEQEGAHLIDITVTDSQDRLTSQAYNLVVENSNRAPSITSSAVLTAQENSNYQYSVLATDPDGDNLSFLLSLAPVGMTIDSQGVITWQPSFEQAGQYEVLVSVSDGQLNVGQNFSVTVGNVNRLPTIPTIPVNTVQEAHEYLYEVLASDLDGDVLAYTLQAAPSGMVISQQGQISWQPNYQQSGHYDITVNVSDGTGMVDENFVVIVENVNRIPTITSQPIVSATEGTPYTYALNAFDADGDSLNYTLSASPAGMEMNANGIINWTPDFIQSGDHSVIVRVTDAGSYSEQAFVVVVANTNRAPVISSEAKTSASENTNFQYAVSATDEDLDVLAYSLTVSPNGMTIDAAGVINWLPTFDQAGIHSVSLQVSDGEFVDTQVFGIEVTNTNRAPVINSNAIQLGAENSAYEYQVMAEDADEMGLTYQLEIAPSGMSITAAGLINWLPSFQQAGDHSVTIVVSDESIAVKQSYILTIENTNRLPIITSQPANTAKEGTQYTYAVQATDDDNNTLTYQLLHAPQGMNIDVTGSVNWLPTYEQFGVHSVSIAVNDGTSSINQDFELSVENTNRAPIVTPSQIPTTRENTALDYDVIATDLDGDVLSYTLVSAPSGMAIDATGQINWTPTFEQAGEHQWVVQVSDQTLTAEQAFSVIVENVNRPPTVAAIADININENHAFSYQVQATDEDSDTLSYTLASFPAGMQINALGLIAWTPNFDQAGRHSIAIVIADAELQITLSFVINVTDTNRPAAITSAPILMASENTHYEYQVVATDADQNTLSFSLNSYPLGMSINVQGLISWTPSFSQSGDHDIRVEVSDGIEVTEQTYTVVVANINRAAVFTSTPLTQVLEKQTYQYTAVANDPDGDALQYGLVIAPSGVTINASTGIVQWETTADSIGAHFIVISAVDALLSQVEQGFTLTVLNVNDEPVITSQPIVNGLENKAYQYQVMAIDEDGDDLNYSFTRNPAGMAIDEQTGLISWLPSFEQAGTHEVSLQVIDGHGLLAEQGFTLAIENLNRTPSVNSQPLLEIEVGEEYQYQVQATDLDNDILVYELTNAPSGMTINADSGLIEWVATGLNVGENAVELSVSDGTEQVIQYFLITVSQPEAPVPLTHMGTEFWFTFNPNIASSKEAENDQRTVTVWSYYETEVTLTSELLSEDVVISLAEKSSYTFDLTKYKNIFDRQGSGISNDAFYIKSKRPIAATLNNKNYASQDSTLLIPAHALGTKYVTLSHDSGNVQITGSGFKTVVVFDDTNILLNFTQDVIWNDEIQLKNVPFSVNLDRGQTIQVTATNNAYGQDIMGSKIESTKPISIFSGRVCAQIRDSACDHLVEQLLPINSLSSHYISVPLATRKKGDTFRAMAVSDNTIYKDSNGEYHVLNSGEFVEELIDGPFIFESNNPMSVAQYSNGAHFDSDQRETDKTMADPFMLTLPPVESYLNEYLISTPSIDIALNFVNLVAPAGASVTHNDVSINNENWMPIEGTNFQYLQYPIEQGSHHFKGDANFGVYQYGYDYYVSYGNQSGMRFRDQRQVENVSVSFDRLTQDIGEDVCAKAVVRDEGGFGIPVVPVTFNNEIFTIANKTLLTNELGEVDYCFTSLVAGTQTVEVITEKGLSDIFSIDWNEALADEATKPEFVNFPGESASDAGSSNLFDFNFDAIDLDGGEVSYTLLAKGTDFYEASNLTLEENTGRMTWDLPTCFDSYPVKVGITDDEGESNIMNFSIHRPKGELRIPNMVSEPEDVSSPVGIIYQFQIKASCFDVYQVGINLVSGPEGLGIVFMYGKGYLRWTPQLGQEGIHEVVYEVNDGKGGVFTKSFNITVMPNQAPVVFGVPEANVFANEDYKYSLYVTDPDGHSYVTTMEQAPEGAEFDGRTFTWTPGLNQIGSHTLSFKVDDGYEGITVQTYELNVLENQSPVVNLIPNAVVTFGESYSSYLASIKDPDGHDVSYSLISGPEGMSYKQLSIIWTPTEHQIGSHRVVIKAIDSLGGVSLLPFYISVLENNAPKIISEDRYYIVRNTDFKLLLASQDLDGHRVTLTIESGPEGVSGYEPGRGKLQLSWNSVTDHLGEYAVRIKAADSIGGQSYKDIIFEVVDDSFLFNVNQSEFTLISNWGWSHVLSTQGSAVTLSLVQGPAGLTFSNDSKKMYWGPDTTQVGEHSVQIQAEDAMGNVKIHDITLRVLAENLAPQISPIASQSAKHDTQWQTDIHITDPEGEAFTLKVESGPKNLYIDPFKQQLNWIPTQLQIGNHTVVISVTDESNHSSQIQFKISVQARANTAPTFVSTPVTKAVLVAPYNYHIVTSDLDGDGTGIELVRGPRGMQLTGNTIWWQAEASQLGSHEVQLLVTDGLAQTYQVFTINVVDENFAPMVSLGSPIDSIELTQPTAIMGVIDDLNIKQWSLKIKEASGGTDQWRELLTGTDSVTGELGILDTTLLMNGQYVLLLTATDTRDLVSQTSAKIFVSGGLKVGHFSFTVNDLEIPLAGIPIRIDRTYDSRRIHEDLDFGMGWSLSINDVKLEESRIPGDGWELREYPSGPLNTLISYCVEPLLPAPLISVTLPNGDVEEFDVQASPHCNTAEPFLEVDLNFLAKNGTQSTLEAIDVKHGRLVNDIIVGEEFINALNPNEYKLTTKEGYIYFINQTTGVVKIEDPNGHSITYTESGIQHSSGKSITFERYSNGHIHKIIDPMGNENNYAYSSSGGRQWLYSHTDALNNRTQYNYLSSTKLYLTEIIDPLNRKLIKNIYDDEGRLKGQEDNEGNIKTFDHDIDAGTSLVTDLDGRSTLFNYDDKGNVTQDIKIITDGSYDGDIVTTLQYDDNDNQTHKTIGNIEYTWVSSFDDDSNQLTATDPEGNVVEYKDYNARGQEGTIIDEMGRETGMKYDGSGNLEQIDMPTLTDADSGAVVNLAASNVINNRGQITQTTDLRGLVSTYTYYPVGHESEGQKHTESSTISGTITYTYDANNNVETESRERTVAGEVITETVTYDYDKRDRLTKTIYPDSSFVQTEYDLAGNVDRERDRFGTWTDYDYDAYGRLLKTTYTDGTFESRTYSAEGLLKSVTDVSNHTTAYKYDDASRLWKTTYHDASFTETQYTSQGWVKSETDGRGKVTRYEYDLAGKREVVIRFMGEREIRHSFTYYKNGELKTETDANGHTTRYGINEYDQRIQTDFHNGSLSKQRYDAMGARTKQIDQNSRSTQYGYDDLGRLKSVQALVQINAEDVPATTYTYDEAGNKLTQSDALLHATSWTYDYYGRVLTRTLPEGMSESFSYDDANRTVNHTDFNGKATTSITNAMGRTESISYHDNKVEAFTYWASGQVKTVTVSETGKDDVVTSYRYDNRDRLFTETQSDGTVLTYHYDMAGNRDQVKVARTIDSGEQTTITDYRYDDLNRLETVIDSSGTTTYTYDDVGNQKTVTYPNGLMTEYIYNDVNQLKNLSTKNANGEVLSSYSYELENTGRREAITEQDGRYTDYSYDNLYRLTDEVIKSSIDSADVNYTANYQYDWVGNRTYETVDGVNTAYAYDDNDRLTSQGGTSYTHDDNGNTLTETLDLTVKTYSYDAKNKLTTVEKAGVVTGFTYNSSGIRNSKTEDGVTTSYVVDSNRNYAQVLEEIISGITTVQYSYGHDLLSQNRIDEFKFYLYDGLGSTRGLSNSAGIVTDTYDYEAFGEVLNETGETDNNYKFTGEQFDSSLDQYYLRARYYDSTIGRFTQQDSYSGSGMTPISLNKYLYVNANPISYVDPTGNFASLSGAMTSLNIMSSLSVGASSTLTRSLLGVGGTVFKGGVIAGSIYSMEVGFKIRENAVKILSYGDMYGGWNEAMTLYRLSGEMIRSFSGFSLNVNDSLDISKNMLNHSGKITKSLSKLVEITLKKRNGTSRIYDYIKLKQIKVSKDLDDWLQAIIDQDSSSVIKIKVQILRGSIDDLFNELVAAQNTVDQI